MIDALVAAGHNIDLAISRGDAHDGHRKLESAVTYLRGEIDGTSEIAEQGRDVLA